MYKQILFILLMLVAGAAMAQVDPPIPDCVKIRDTILRKEVYRIVDREPEPVIGFAKLSDAISKNIKASPKYSGLHGNVFVAFVVEKDGRLDGFRAVREIAPDKHYFSDQVFKLLKNYKWKPGACHGKAVPVFFVMPVRIGLQQ